MRLALPLALLPLAAAADVPEVVTDIAPIHSLVAQVMGDLGQPVLLLPPGATPHDFQLRPSQAAALNAADLVIWSGPGLVPWLAESLPGLAAGAETRALLESDGWTRPDRRAPGAAADDDHEGHDEHDEHDEHDDDEDGHEPHADSHGESHDDHGPIDPHAWTDPTVAIAWVDGISATLSALDPENAETYAANARAAGASIAALDARLEAQLAPVSSRPFLLPHDALRYFEARYDLTSVGALADGHGTPPGPARIAALRHLVEDGDVVCLLQDPETDPAWLDLVSEGAEIARAAIDVDGTAIPPGPGLYETLMTDLGTALETCLTP